MSTPSTVELVTTVCMSSMVLAGGSTVPASMPSAYLARWAKKPIARVVGEDLLPARGEGDRDVPGQRDAGDPGPAQLAGLDQDGGG